MSGDNRKDNLVYVVIFMVMFVIPVIYWVYQAVTNSAPSYNRCEPHWTSEGYVSDCTDEEARGEERKLMN